MTAVRTSARLYSEKYSCYAMSLATTAFPQKALLYWGWTDFLTLE